MAVLSKRVAPFYLADAPWAMHEFFAGSGLVAYGLRGMFRTVWANDISEKKAEVYESNFGDDHFLLDDIKNIHGEDLPFAHLSWASFPCQDLSLAGSLGGIDASRSGLVWEWLRILDEMTKRPAVLLIENVAGLLSSNQGKNYEKLHLALVQRGYNVGAMVINAAHFVPQSRPRVFIAAVRDNVGIPTELIDSGPNWLHNKAAADLGTVLPNWIWWRADRLPHRRTHLADIIDYNAPFDKDSVLQLITPMHKAKLESMENTVATGYRRTRNGKQCFELRFDGVAGCLRTPEGGSSKQFVVVKQGGETHARLLTLREAARLMGAPDDFILPIVYNDGYKAMGDAVVAPVARFVGQVFLTKLMEAAYGKQQYYGQTESLQRRA
jgi:DNA (cytosine-5)-methyltransferase 1